MNMLIYRFRHWLAVLIEGQDYRTRYHRLVEQYCSVGNIS